MLKDNLIELGGYGITYKKIAAVSNLQNQPRL